jgi:thymidylate synthase
VNLQLSREAKPYPKMMLNTDIKDIFNFNFSDFTVEGYEPWPAIKAPVAI